MKRKVAWAVLMMVFSPLFTLAVEAETYYRVKFEDGHWWFLSPQGERFISRGVDSTLYHPGTARGSDTSQFAETNKKKYGSPQAWREATARRLLRWNFNTLGTWSDPLLSKVSVNNRRLAYSHILNFAGDYVREIMTNGVKPGNSWLDGIFPDVFDPQFEFFVRQSALRQCRPLRKDQALLGWFTDNELRWGPDWRNSEELLVSFLNMDSGSFGRKAAVLYLRSRYVTAEEFNRVWKTKLASWADLENGIKIQSPYHRKSVYMQNAEMEHSMNSADPGRDRFVRDCEAFLEQVSELYFRICTDAIRRADSNHLVFGCRFAYVPATPVVAAAAKYLDAVSFNCYAERPAAVIERYAVFGKPLIIGEFSFRAKDSGLPNTKGAGMTVETQSERAHAFEIYVREALSHSNVVGYHWFQYADQPREGRQLDGENSNYGIVNADDVPYLPLVEAMQRVNNDAEEAHAQAIP